MTRFLWVVLLVSGCALAQDKPKAWSNQIDLGGVWTSGNSESSNLSLKEAYTWKSDRADFNLNLAAVRADNARITRFAIGTPDDYDVIEDRTRQLSAENYSFGMRYGQKISARTSWFVSTDWARDEIAGLKNRYGLAAGLANVLADGERHKLKTSYGAKWVDEQNVFEPAGFDGSYPALALVLDQWLKVTKTSEYSQRLAIDANTDESKDWRANWNHGFSVSVNGAIAIKLGLTLQYDNQPAFVAVPLQGSTEVIALELDELDTIFTTALVIKL